MPHISSKQDLFHLADSQSSVPRHARTAFSLPEMLAVIAIVMIILSILMPALGQSKEAVYSVKCQNNLHQIMETMAMFRAHNNGSIDVLPGAFIWQTYVESVGVGSATRCPKDGRGENSDSIGSLDGSSTIQYLATAPADARFNQLEHNSNIFAFRERESYALPSPVKVDISNPGYVDKPAHYSPATIPKGVEVDSFFLHFDSVGNQGASTSGVVNVRGQIIGLIVEDATLNQTDSTLGAEGTQYSTGQGARGFETNAEKITLTDDMKTVEIHQWKISFPGEEMRILTVPGGFSSYGMNNQAPHQTWARGSQVLFAEYDKSIVDVDFKHGNNDDFDKWLAKRHFGKSNILFGDSSVKLMEEKKLNPSTTDVWEFEP